MALRIALSFLVATATAYPRNTGLKREESPTVGLRVAQNSTVPASIVPVGYSQGAQLVHNAVKQLSAAVLKRIKALVTFGDPDKFYGIEGVPTDKILIICHDADIICSGIPLLALLLLLGSSEHLDYDENVGTAADFILGRVFTVFL